MFGERDQSTDNFLDRLKGRRDKLNLEIRKKRQEIERLQEEIKTLEEKTTT